MLKYLNDLNNNDFIKEKKIIFIILIWIPFIFSYFFRRFNKSWWLDQWL